MIIDLLNKIRSHYDQESFLDEDRVIWNFLENLPRKNKLKVLEIGSGRGRFALKMKNHFKFDITCLEINPNLAKLTENYGLKTIKSDFLKSKLPLNEYDIIHSSHFIEHFKYPEISYVLDKMFSIVKPDGYVIIRSPLFHRNFYLDIDHFRPYPPETILNYMRNAQQQSVGNFQIEEVVRWYRRPPVQITQHTDRLLVQIINSLLLVLWTKNKIFSSKADGYVSIFKKI